MSYDLTKHIDASALKIFAERVRDKFVSKDKFFYMLTHIDNWSDIQTAVRMGLAPLLFPVGYEFTMPDSDTGNTLTWVVRGHDHHKAADESLKHTMTLELKNLYSDANGSYKQLIFDSREAFYYCSQPLSAGTYNFTWDYATEKLVNGTYQFTLTQPVPAGGQIYLNTIGATNAITGCTISTYADIGAAEVVESDIIVTEGSEGTDLGTISIHSRSSENLNCGQRAVFGSNNYAQSAVRQWLNSASAAGAVWKPQTKFNRAPSWSNTFKGFMHGLPADFLESVQPAIIPCYTTGNFEIESLDGTEFTTNQVYNLTDKFFLLSRPELYGTWDSTTYKDGEQIEYYKDMTSTELIKYDQAGTARGAMLRSPASSFSGYERSVTSLGSLGQMNAYANGGVAPACIIA